MRCNSQAEAGHVGPSPPQATREQRGLCATKIRCKHLLHKLKQHWRNYLPCQAGATKRPNGMSPNQRSTSTTHRKWSLLWQKVAVGGNKNPFQKKRSALRLVLAQARLCGNDAGPQLSVLSRRFADKRTSKRHKKRSCCAEQPVWHIRDLQLPSSPYAFAFLPNLVYHLPDFYVHPSLSSTCSVLMQTLSNSSTEHTLVCP